MEDGGGDRHGAEPSPQVRVRDAAGPGVLVPLLPPVLGAPEDGAARGAPPGAGGSSPGPLSRSLRKAEAMLRGCVSPGLRRLLPPRPRRCGPGSEDEDEDEDEASAVLTPLERSFPGLRRCLCVREDPRTETFHGHVRPPPCDADTDTGTGTAAAFSFHPVHPRVAERGAALHALLRHRHLLCLTRDYTRRLRSASRFLRRLLALLREPEPEPPLRELCRELRVHTGHWSVLRRRLREDPWLRELVLHRGEAVAHMRRALVLLALQALSLTEHLAEARLRALVRTGSAAASLPELLSDLFQGLELYNRALGELEPELSSVRCLPTGPDGRPGAAEPTARPFPVSRVLQVVAAERGWMAAERLRPFLRPRNGAGGDEPVRWEDTAVPWPPELGAAADTGSCSRDEPELSAAADTGSCSRDEPELSAAADTGSCGRDEPLGITGTLRALCREDEELMGLLLGVLVASSGSLQHHVLHVPKEKPPAAAPEEPQEPGCAGWAAEPAAQALLAQYRPLFWGAAATALGHGAELLPGGTSPAAVLELSRAIGAAPVPRECREELGRLSLGLLCHGALRSWDSGFTRALGSALSDKCSGAAVPASGLVRSRTAMLLQGLYPALGLALRCLRPLPDLPPGPPCLRLQVLGCCLATVQAAHSWLTGRACRYLAAWALPQFLLVTQGDLQLLKMETDKLVLLVNGTFPEPEDVSPPPSPPLMSCQELQLCQHICSMATSIQLFSGAVLQMFSTGCKRMSAQIFHQTMPRGKHWRISLRPELPSCPSAYAAAAAQAVLGQVLQGARLLPRDAQAPAMAGGTTAFLEAWMEHILEQRIRFSLQGALQLRQDFELVRELVGSERSGLAPETRRELVALSVFQQMDGAILCLLQQPGAVGRAGARPWSSIRHCCSDHGSHPPEPPAGIAQGPDPLQAPVAPGPCAAGAAGPVPGRQQQWLALRLHRARRWRVPGLPCIRDPSGQ